MNRNISDLLDGISFEDIGIKQTTPLSACRIKEKVMKNVGQKKPIRFRWLTRVVVIVAVIVTLTFTVFAADAALGEGKLVAGFFGLTLSEDQLELVDDIGRDFPGSVTAYGTTVTPMKAIADEDFYLLHLKVEAPEDVVLPDLEDGYYYDFQPARARQEYHNDLMMKIEYRRNYVGNSIWHELWFSHSVTTLEDADPADNVKEFVIEFTNKSDTSIYNGPWEKQLTFYGLYIRKERDSSYCERKLGGYFTFEIGIDDEDRDENKLVVDTGDLSFYNGEYDYSTTIHEITITPLAITVDYTCSEPNNKYIFGRGGPIQFVMKDGTVFDALDAYYDASAHTYPHPDSVAGVGNYSCFTQIIDVKQIDYLLIGGEHKIDVN